MKKDNAKFFLAANSAEGFFSYFDRCYDPADGWQAYIIKGGPGTGKSSFMKKVLKRAEERSVEAVEIFCASDPDSLDGVIMPSLKTVILDGTAPHVVEPRYPGASDRILNFGQFWNEAVLRSKRAEIVELTAGNKDYHRKTAELICRAGRILKNELEASAVDKKRTQKLSEELSQKYFSEKENCRREWIRFSGGVTPKGMLYITSTDTFERSVVLDGPADFASEVINNVKDVALEKGREVITLKNPILPSRLTDGLIVPELSLFISANPKRLLNADAEQLINEAAAVLTQAKTNHDELEKCYIAAMNFGAVDRFGEDFCEKLFG